MEHLKNGKLKMTIEEYNKIIQQSFRIGMEAGYGVDHSDIVFSENEMWEYYKEILELKIK